MAELFADFPPVSLGYAALCCATTILCSLDLLSVHAIGLNFKAIWRDREWYRLATNFFYFGHVQRQLDIFTVFINLSFLIRNCKSLEGSFYRNRPADFLWMLVVGATLILITAPLVPELTFILSWALATMIQYVWARRNQHVLVNIMGFIVVRAPYVPWVTLAIHTIFGTSLYVQLLGIGAGHLYWYLEDVVPVLFPGAFRPLETPNILRMLLGQPPSGIPKLPPIRPIPGARIIRFDADAHDHAD